MAAAAFSALATFDDIRRCHQVLTDPAAEEEFLRIVRMQEKFRLECISHTQKAQRIQKELDISLENSADLEIKLSHARRLLELENKARREAEHVRDQLEKKIVAVAELLEQERNLKDEIKAKLAFLNILPRKRKLLNSNDEEKSSNDINSTNSFLSDLSLTHSEDDFPDVLQTQNCQKLPKNSVAFIRSKRLRLSDADAHSTALPIHSAQMCATTKSTIPQDNYGLECTLESTLTTELKPEVEGECGITSTSPELLPLKQLVQHQHNFASKTFISTDICMQCQKVIHFGSIGLRCCNCPICCHVDCLNLLTIACLPQQGTSTIELSMGYISDYAPTIPPMIPAILLRCVNEIEARGFNEVGIYCVTGSEREVKFLKESFLFGEGNPHLGNIDIHVLCNCIKDFLRSLREPLIPTCLWNNFSNAVKNHPTNIENIQSELFKAIDELPQANRDTLAFLILHFQRIAECPEVRMPIDNIARVFGPTIVDYSSPDPDKHVIFREVFTQFSIMQHLIQIPADYWLQFVSCGMANEHNGNRGKSLLGSNASS